MSTDIHGFAMDIRAKIMDIRRLMYVLPSMLAWILQPRYFNGPLEKQLTKIIVLSFFCEVKLNKAKSFDWLIK